jgi:hypothetical protein
VIFLQHTIDQHKRPLKCLSIARIHIRRDDYIDYAAWIGCCHALFIANGQFNTTPV